MSIVNLEKEISKNAAVVSTQSYSMSVGEIIRMYIDKEIDLHPEYQRFFRWTPEQKSRLIESFLLGIPIPPIFVSERHDSKWDVIDGLQRLSTILELVGELRDENGNLKEPLILGKTRYLPSLEGKQWKSDNSDQELSESVRIRIKRTRLDANIVRSSSDDIAKYEIFQRLNSGGTHATDQEIRNCILIMTNRSFYEWVKNLSDYENFRACLNITDRAIEEAFDMELVVRFIVLATIEGDKLGPPSELGEFLTEELIKRAKNLNFNKEAAEYAFKATFDFLADSLHDNSFRRYDSKKKKHVGAMLISLFEVVAIGLGYRLLNHQDLPDKETFILKHNSLWDENALSQFSRMSAAARIPKTIAYGRGWFDK